MGELGWQFLETAHKRAILRGIEDGAVWGLEALFRKLARQRQLRAFVAPQRFYEIGSVAGRRDLEEHLRAEAAP